MASLRDEMLCYCTGDTVGAVCRLVIEAGSAGEWIGNYCTGCRDDVKLLCRVLREDPDCVESDDRLLASIERALVAPDAPVT